MNIVRFSQILCSRLCHDLITPVSAINSGLEILQDCDEKDRAQVQDVLKQSAATASARLVFFRAALGASAGSLSSFEAISGLLETFLNSIKIEFSWSKLERLKEIECHDFDLIKWGKALLNLVFIASEAAPYGGKMVLSTQVDDSFPVTTFQLKGNLVGLKPHVIAGLLGELKEDELTPHTIQAYLTYLLMNDLGIFLSYEAKSNEILEFTLLKKSASKIQDDPKHVSLF
jgi:histidine phosphotransferase ChpT